MDSLNYDLLDPMKSSTRKHPHSARTKETLHERLTSRQGSKAQGVDEDPRVVVGVDIGGSNLRVALADLHGTVLGKWSASTKETSSPEMVIAQIGKGIDSLLKDSSFSRSSLAAIAAGAPGITDRDAGVVIATSFLRGWRDVPFQSLLESAFHVPAAVENDVRMAALGEHWMGGARGISDFVFLAIGTGIAAGIFANGTLLQGADCTAGEVGYLYVPGASELVAQLGTPGSLESTIGGDGIRQQWQEAGRSSAHSKHLNATEVFDLALTGDSLAKVVLDRSARLLAYAVYNISLVLNPSLFVLGGGVGMNRALRDATDAVLQRHREPAQPKLVISSLGQDAQLMGAIRLALDTVERRTA
jgi:glucokinase